MTMKTCNQCGEEMSDNDKLYILNGYVPYFCCKPSCPNYSLLQIPAEDMPLNETST